MRIAISAGHNVYVGGNFDPGAVNRPHVEADINKETVAILISLLKKQGHEVFDVTPYNQRFDSKYHQHKHRADAVNRVKPDIFIDVHLNAGGGTGVECFVYSSKSKSYPYATKICKSISSNLGLRNRGVKFNPGFYSLRLNSYPSIIVEGAFIDNAGDMSRLNTRNYAESIARTFGDIKETPKIPTRSEYLEIGDAKIIKTDPDNIYIYTLGDTLHRRGVYGINGTFFDTNTAPVTSPNSCVFIAMNGGKAVSNNAQFNGWNKPPRATLIYHTNGKLGFRKLKDVNPIRNNTIWAVGGYMVKPYMDFKNEQIPSSVNYKTAHTYIGYDKDDNLYLIVKPNHMISEIVPLMNQLGIINAIVIDGGGSSQLNHRDGSYRSSRKINTSILLKEV